MQFRGDSSRVVKDSCLADAYRDRPGDLLLRVLVSPIAAERPGVCVERIHVVASRDFDLGDAQSFRGIVTGTEIVRDEFLVCVLAAANQWPRRGCKVRVSQARLLGFTGALQGLSQRISACGRGKFQVALAEQVSGFGIALPRSLDAGQAFQSRVVAREFLQRRMKEFFRAVEVASGKLQIRHLGQRPGQLFGLGRSHLLVRLREKVGGAMDIAI